MTKKDVLELKRRFKKEACTFTRLCGCYVDSDKNEIVKLNETFLNLEDEEFYKYLEIAKKVLSGTLGNNLLELEFPMEEEFSGGRQQFLMGLNSSALENEELLDRFYEQVIEKYQYVGNYLILLFHDCYDVMKKTSDKLDLDESEEVYEYLLCAICPVTLSKPALGYREDENRIGPRIRDWVVGVPDTGFLFPAFTDRSSDIHATLFYTKNVKEPHVEVMEEVLGCPSKRTATEKKTTFNQIMDHALGREPGEDNALLMEFQENLNGYIEEQAAGVEEPENVETPLTEQTLNALVLDSGFSEETASQITKAYTEEFGDLPPAAESLVDAKAIAANAPKKREKELVQQVNTLTEQLEKKEFGAISEDDAPEIKTYDVILRVKPEKAPQIQTKIVDGQKCIVIPLDENECATINGIHTTV
ncbi:MAG: DUF4317 domain-containing protein [Lachnospiraceae bacterium]